MIITTIQFSWKKKHFSTGEPPSHYIIYLFRYLITECDWRAVEPLNQLPLLLFESVNATGELSSRRATKSVTILSFFNQFMRLACHQAAEPLNHLAFSFFDH